MSPKNTKPHHTLTPRPRIYIALLACGHKAVVIDPQVAVTCPVCHLTAVPKSARTFHEERFDKFVPLKEQGA